MKKLSWDDGPKPGDLGWGQDAAVTDRILGKEEWGNLPIPVEWARRCLKSIQEMRGQLAKDFVGLVDADRGNLTEWALACLIARENLLLLGPPGVAKTEIAERIFGLQGLITPTVGDDLPEVKTDSAHLGKWWRERETQERAKHKYFRYLLSRFTQPEETFGPIEIDLLRRGMLVHVNFGLLTSPGVRAAFLDEIFKASSSILNALLTLVLEREYFNWGGMRRSDLVMFIGASNELPGGLATGHLGAGAGAEDFNLLYAFLDRFPIRLEIPNASGTNSTGPPEESDLAKATNMALHRETNRFRKGKSFDDDSVPCSINDVLLVGRVMMDGSGDGAVAGEKMFDAERLRRFRKSFFSIAANLQSEGTGLRASKITWTISPRKLKALYKIALAHALIVDDGFARGGVVAGPNKRDLRVFDFIWDTPLERDTLRTRINALTGGMA